MTSLNASTRISPADFVDNHPELFALYQRLMTATLSWTDAAHKQVAEKFGLWMLRINNRFAQTKQRAESAYELSTREILSRYNNDQRSLKQALDQTLARLEAERNASQERFGKEAEAEGERLKAQFGTDPAAQACYRELGLPERAFNRERDGELYAQAARAITLRQIEKRMPSDKIFSDAAAAAHQVYNQELTSLNEKTDVACRPYMLILARQMQVANRNKRRAAARMSQSQTRETEKLEQRVLILRDRRLKLIESFLATRDGATLRTGLEAELAFVSAAASRNNVVRFVIFGNGEAEIASLP